MNEHYRKLLEVQERVQRQNGVYDSPLGVMTRRLLREEIERWKAEEVTKDGTDRTDPETGGGSV